MKFNKKNNLLLLTGLLTAPALASAIELTDYMTVDSMYDEAYVSGRFNLNSGNQDQTSFDGSLLGYYDIVNSTLPRVFRLRFDGKVDFNRGSADGDSTSKGYNFLAGASVDNYFKGDDKLLWFGSADFGYRRGMGSDEADDPFAKFGVGIGYGRVIDATPLASALRVVEELNKYGILIKQPSDQNLLALAAIISKEEEYESKYGFEDYEQKWLQDIEVLMKDAGLLKDTGLSTVGTLKIFKVLVDERVSVRKHGWIAKAGAGIVASNYNGETGDPSLDLSFEYAKPYGHELQFLELAKYSTIFEDDVTHNFSNMMSLSYEISDKIDWENKWELNVTMPTTDNANDTIRNDLSSVFRYYLSNRLDANLSVVLSKTDDDIDDNGNDDVDTSIFAGITYRLK
jgi:hypothetical protein